MTTWDEMLADLSERLDEVERALAVQAPEDLQIPPFAPPDVTDEMTSEQRQRAAVLLERLERCRSRLADGMASAQRDLAELDARRRGARTYARSDLGVG